MTRDFLTENGLPAADIRALNELAATTGKAPPRPDPGPDIGGPGNGKDQTAGINDLNAQFAVVTIGGHVRIMDLLALPAAFYKLGDFNLLLQNRKIEINGSGAMSLAKWWLGHPDRLQYKGIVFEPGGPQVINGHRNLWSGFSVKPRPGDCSLYLNFLCDIICSGNRGHYEYLLNLLADTVQRPNKQGDVAIVLRGKEGVGKGFAANQFGKLFGPHFVPVNQAAHVTGRFNSHLEHCSILFCDEAFFAGDRQHASTLKALITEPEIMIERKGIDSYKAANKIHIWIASNEDWVVPAGANARRFFCLDVSDARRNDTSYFGAIDRQMKEGGLAALLDLLLKHRLLGVDIRDVPLTAALAEQKAQSRRGVDALVEMIAADGSVLCPHPTNPSIAITTDPDRKEKFHDLAKREIPSLRFDAPTVITQALYRDWGCKPWHSGNRRGIRFPELSVLRDKFGQKHGHIEWSTEIVSWGDGADVS